jgi:hypothetical protein
MSLNTESCSGVSSANNMSAADRRLAGMEAQQDAGGRLLE